MKTITAQTTRQVFLFYWQQAAKYPLFVLGAFIAMPITVLVNTFLPPLILANVLNRLSAGEFVVNQPWQSFGGDISLYILLTLSGSIVLWRIVDACVWTVEGRVQRDLARKVFNHLMSRSADFHANNFSGSLVSQTNKLLGSYIRIADTTIFGTLPLLLSIVFTSVILFPRAPWFVVGLIVLSLLYIVLSFKVSAPVRKVGAYHSRLESKQTGYLADAITNAMAIKSFAADGRERQSFDKVTNRTHKALKKVMFAHQKQMLFFGTASGTISAASLILAVVSVVSFGANIATAFLIFNYTASIVQQLFQFSNNAIRNYNRAIGDASDMVSILDEPAEVQDPANPESSKIVRGDIRLVHTTFKHKGSNEPIFKNLNLHIKPGEKVGLVGQSGSGKSSLTRILLRFSDIDGGEILLDNQNIARITQNDLRRAIAYVPQEPLLFHRSIAENIGYSSGTTDLRVISAVARKANAHEFIEALPEKYDTLVGERGVKLSGGQRQRIAIARAMLKNAPILVLDEATSALDSESEVLIQDALWKLMEGRTAIVIAHRLSTIQKMDRILVMDKGKIIEEGSHKDLLRLNGTYAKLWNHQSGGFLEEETEEQ